MSTRYHNHHIIPKHQWLKIHGNLNGVNDKSNLVSLTIKEHADAHKKLWQKNNYQEDYIAWKALDGQWSVEDIIYAVQCLPKSKSHKEAIRQGHLNPKNPDKNRDSYSKCNTGERNPRAKEYLLISPEGEKFQIKSLKTFCKERGLTYDTFCPRPNQRGGSTRLGNTITKGRHIGWQVYDLSTDIPKENF